MDRNNEPRDGQVIDFSAIRDAKIEEKRRKYERVLFKNILGVYCVAEGEGLKAVELIDISPEGLSFQLPVGSPNTKSIQVGTEMTIRFYFSQDTFIPVSLKVNNSRPCIEEGSTYTRYGCSVSKDTQSYETYKTFAQFLALYAETSHNDRGDLKLFYF